MTDTEAAVEATRRWGGLAVARDRAALGYATSAAERYMVGVYGNRVINSVVVHGEGPTWEAAFADASAREEVLKP